MSDSGNKKLYKNEQIQEIQFLLTNMYLLLMFAIFPLFIVDRYGSIGFHKWQFFRNVTCIYGGVMLVSYLPTFLTCIASGHFREKVNRTDIAVALYGVTVFLSFLLAENHQEAWLGAEGWYMGTEAQMLFVGIYFIMSRSRFSRKLFVAGSVGGLLLCLLIGIGQRLGWDFLRLYDGMDPAVLSDFLSTIGNRTWMSGYVCVIAPIAFSFFGKTDDSRKKIFWGCICSCVCAGVAATYSDSVYVGVAASVYGLVLLSDSERKKQLSCMLLMDIWFGTSLFMCLLRGLRGTMVRDARGITSYVYDWKLALTGFLVCLAVTLVWKRIKTGDGQKQTVYSRRKIRWVVFVPVILAVMCGLILIANSTGLLEKNLGFTITNKYLYFDDAWGDNRGWTWKMIVKMWGELPFRQKLFGVGADCFAYYCYSSPEYSGEFVRIWQDMVLANAHNEWLNMFFCQGITGGLAYLGIFICCGIEFLKKSEEELPQAIGLSILAYVAHNFFCYQQVCATAPMFILLGVGVACRYRSAPA